MIDKKGKCKCSDMNCDHPSHVDPIHGHIMFHGKTASVRPDECTFCEAPANKGEFRSKASDKPVCKQCAEAMPGAVAPQQ